MLPRLRKDIYLSGISQDLLDRSVNNGWFDDSETNWKNGFGRGLPGTIISRDLFLRDINRPDELVKLVGIYKDIYPIGYASIEPVSEAHKTVKLYIYLENEARGKGYAPTVLTKLLNSIFDAGAYRVEVETLKINKAAIRWLRHSGFTQESIKRSSYWMENNVFDSVILRMLRPEFRKIYQGV